MPEMMEGVTDSATEDFLPAMAVRRTSAGLEWLMINADTREIIAKATLSKLGSAELINMALEEMIKP